MPSSETTTPLSLSWWRVLLLGGVLLAIALAVAPGSTDGRLNVIVVVSDSLRASNLEAYGYSRETSPRISREIRRSGAVYRRAYSHYSFTWPSLSNLFTGLPFSSLVEEKLFTAPTGREELRYQGGLQPRVSTLAEMLADEGVRSYGVSGSPYITSATGFGQGFTRFHDWSRWRDRPREGNVPYVPADQINEVAIQYLRELRWAKRQPWFLYLHYMDTHMAYHATEKDIASFRDPAYDRADRVRGGAALDPDGKWLKWLTPDLEDWLTPADVDHLIAHYDAQIRRFDREMGILFDYLESTGLRENTVVILTSDHGEAFFERGFWGHGFLSRVEEQHVPLVVIFPPTESGETHDVDFPVTTTDIFHTILSHFGADERSSQTLPQVADLFTMTPLRDVAYTEGPGGTRIYRSEKYSLYQHRALHKRGYPLPVENGDFLFDVSADPGEQRDLLANHDDGAEKQRDALVRRGPDSLSDAEITDPMFAAKGRLRKSLRALGYLAD